MRMLERKKEVGKVSKREKEKREGIRQRGCEKGGMNYLRNSKKVTEKCKRKKDEKR